MMSCFVTCGRGMDYFVVKELHNIIGVNSIEATDGKVFFNFENKKNLFDVEPLYGIKSAERIFLNVFKGEKPFKCSIDLLFNGINDWKNLIEQWQKLRRGVTIPPSSDSTPPPKKLKTSTDDQITFRINLKSTGVSSRFRNTSSFAFKLAKKIEEILSWKTELKEAELEIYVHWNDDCLLIGFPLTKLPLSKRPYLNNISLRTTVCWAMAYSADLKPGYIVCDPMCGSGTILIELLKCWPLSLVYGFDICSEQLERAVNNITRAKVTDHVQLINCSVETLPLRTESIDAVLCDYPFGLQYGTLTEVKILLPKALKEMNRICRNNGTIVMLISLQLSEFLMEQVKELFSRTQLTIKEECRKSSTVNVSINSWWKPISNNQIKLGILPATICVFKKRNGQ